MILKKVTDILTHSPSVKTINSLDFCPHLLCWPPGVLADESVGVILKTEIPKAISSFDSPFSTLSGSFLHVRLVTHLWAVELTVTEG